MVSEFSSPLLVFEESNVYGLHFMVPRDIAEKYISKKDKRVICELDGLHTHHCALMPDGNGEFYIMINKALKKKLGFVLGQKVKISMKKDESKYGMPMPEELGELLAIDELGNSIFHQLTPGRQRNLIHIVSKYKNTETRINKALVIVDYLKRSNGVIDFKELNEAFKNHNSL